MRGKPVEGKKSRTRARAARRSSLRARIPRTEVTVTFRHVEPTEALRLYAERKLGHLSRFVKRPCQAHLILTVDKYRQQGEVIVKSGRLAASAKEETKDLYAVIDLLADKVGRQLKSHIGKVITRRERASSAGEVLSAAEEIVPHG